MWGAQTSQKKHKPKAGWGAQTKPARAGRPDRDDNHPDEGGEVWEGTRRFGPFREKKQK